MSLRKLLSCFFLMLATAITLYRFWKGLMDEGIDFRAYYDGAVALLGGRDPFDVHNLPEHWKLPPIVVPGAMPFMAPFLPLRREMATLVFNFIGLGCFVSTLALVWNRAGLTWKGWLSWETGILLMLINSVPFLQVVRLGQITHLVFWLVALSLFRFRGVASGLLLGLAAALKYSLPGFFGLALLFRRRWVPALTSLAFFAASLASPALFGHSLYPLYTKYQDTVVQTLGPRGLNSWAGGGGWDMVHVGFFIHPILNACLALFYALMGVLGFAKFAKEPRLTLHFLLFVSCLTMVFTYHRVHDLSFSLILLSAILIHQVRLRDHLQVAISISFFLYFLLPRGLHYRLQEKLSYLWMQNGLVYTTGVNNVLGFDYHLPLDAWVTGLLLIYSFVLYQKESGLSPCDLIEEARP